MLACTRTAISALAWLVSATSPSIPAVLRPVLRCVTCRTLTSVLLQLRSASFCRFLASGQSPACTALKIRPRPVPPPRGTASPHAPRRHHRTRAGPQVRSPKCPTCPSVPAFTLASSQRLTCPRQRPCGPKHQARYPASYTGTVREETRPCGTRLPAAFRPPAFASWAPCPARGFRPSYDRPTDRPAPTRACRADPGEVSTFRTHETRTGPGALYTPGTAVFAGRRLVRGRRLPPLSGRSLAPRYNNPARDVSLTRHPQGFPDSRPVPVLPLTCDRHGWHGGPW